MHGPLHTDVLILGGGPGPVLAAQMLAARGVRSVLAHHTPSDDVRPVCLSPASIATLAESGVLAAVRACAATGNPLATSPAALESIVLRYCIADVCVAVYDRLRPAAVDLGPGGEVSAVLDDGGGRSWDVRASALLDAQSWPAPLDDAIGTAAHAVRRLLPPAATLPPLEQRTTMRPDRNAHPTGG